MRQSCWKNDQKTYTRGFVGHRVRRSLTFAFALALVAMTASTIEARPRPRKASKFVANKTFGLGVMIGAPTGLSGKYYLSKDTALDFGVGAYRRYRFDSALQIHADYLIHPVNLAKTTSFYMPLYLGIGGRILFREFDDRDDDDLHLGVRAPIGLAIDFNDVPLDIFFELALVVDLIVAGDGRFFADINGAVGLRYYFE